MSEQVKLLGFEQLGERGVGYSRTHIRRLEKRREFPQHVHLGSGRIGWVESEIDDYLAERVARRDAAYAPKPARRVLRREG